MASQPLLGEFIDRYLGSLMSKYPEITLESTEHVYSGDTEVRFLYKRLHFTTLTFAGPSSSRLTDAMLAKLMGYIELIREGLDEFYDIPVYQRVLYVKHKNQIVRDLCGLTYHEAGPTARLSLRTQGITHWPD